MKGLVAWTTKIASQSDSMILPESYFFDNATTHPRLRPEVCTKLRGGFRGYPSHATIHPKTVKGQWDLTSPWIKQPHASKPIAEDCKQGGESNVMSWQGRMGTAMAVAVLCVSAGGMNINGAAKVQHGSRCRAWLQTSRRDLPPY